MPQVSASRLRDSLDAALRRGADPLVRARALQDLRRQLEDVEAEIVDAAWRPPHWYSWSRIGEAFGVRKQSIWAKHHARQP